MKQGRLMRREKIEGTGTKRLKHKKWQRWGHVTNQRKCQTASHSRKQGVRSWNGRWRCCCCCWALTVSVQLSLSDPSTTLASVDDWLRLCSHNHIHLLLYTQCNQAKSISTIKTSKIKNFVIDLCIVLLIVIPISLCFILANTTKFWKKLSVWNPGPSSLHHSGKRTEGWRTMFTATAITQISVTQRL